MQIRRGSLFTVEPVASIRFNGIAAVAGTGAHRQPNRRPDIRVTIRHIVGAGGEAREAKVIEHKPIDDGDGELD